MWPRNYPNRFLEQLHANDIDLLWEVSMSKWNQVKPKQLGEHGELCRRVAKVAAAVPAAAQSGPRTDVLTQLA